MGSKSVRRKGICSAGEPGPVGGVLPHAPRRSEGMRSTTPRLVSERLRNPALPPQSQENPAPFPCPIVHRLSSLVEELRDGVSTAQREAAERGKQGEARQSYEPSAKVPGCGDREGP